MSTPPAVEGSSNRAGSWIARLSEVQEPLASALEILAGHSEALRAVWWQRLDRLAFTSSEREAMSSLFLPAYLPDVRAGRFDALARALEREGHALAMRGMLENQALGALFELLECSLPYIVREGAGDRAAALVRLTFAGGLALTAGYAAARTTSWRSFGEQERHRLSRDLHDEIGHHLVVLKLYLGMIVKETSKARPTQIREKLAEAIDLVSQAIQAVRRLILDLGPVALEGVGFLPAIKLYARQFSARTGVKVHVRDTELPTELPSTHEAALYRILQGALSNVLKHAQAGNVKVTVGSPTGTVVAMSIEDDGVGFDTEAPHRAFGLAAMRSRVTSLGGRLRVDSRPADSRRRHGTRIDIELPLAEKRSP